MGTSLASRYRGALLGLAVGDGLGAPFEGRRRVSEDAVRSLAAASSALRHTDDTAMAMGVAESLVERGGFDGDHMMWRFATDHATEPWRGYGAGTVHVLELYMRGVPRREAARRVFRGGGSFGNGAAMRAAPAALFAYPGIEPAASLGRLTAELTHAHSLGVEGAAFQAAAVSHVLATTADIPLSAEGMCAAIAAVLTSDLYLARLDRVLALLPGDPPPGAVAAALGRSSSAPESVPAALYCFLRHSGSLVDAVSFAVLLGGDTDSIAAMTGALSGAFLGEEALPAGWFDRIEQGPRLRGLADALSDLTRSGAEAVSDR